MGQVPSANPQWLPAHHFLFPFDATETASVDQFSQRILTVSERTSVSSNIPLPQTRSTFITVCIFMFEFLLGSCFSSGLKFSAQQLGTSKALRETGGKMVFQDQPEEGVLRWAIHNFFLRLQLLLCHTADHLGTKCISVSSGSSKNVPCWGPTEIWVRAMRQLFGASRSSNMQQKSLRSMATEDCLVESFLTNLRRSLIVQVCPLESLGGSNLCFTFNQPLHFPLPA